MKSSSMKFPNFDASGTHENLELVMLFKSEEFIANSKHPDKTTK